VSDLLEVIGRGLDPPRRSLVSSRAAALQLHS
jgi:hypothetical protein